MDEIMTNQFQEHARTNKHRRVHSFVKPTKIKIIAVERKVNER